MPEGKSFLKVAAATAAKTASKHQAGTFSQHRSVGTTLQPTEGKKQVATGERHGEL